MDRILSLTPIPTIILDSSQRILQISQGFTVLTGFSRQGCESHNITDVIRRSPFLRKISLRTEIDSAVASKRPTYSEPHDIDEKCYRTRIAPIYDGQASFSLSYIQVEFEDCTEEQRKFEYANARLREAETFRLLVNTVKDYAIFLLDPTGHVATWNSGARILKQYLPHEIIGKHFRCFYSQDAVDACIPEMELEIAVAEGKFEDSGWRYRKDGSSFWANVVITPTFNDDGILIGFTKVTRDMTERHLADAQMVADYEEASKLKSQFLANMSHEIRSPMHGMLSAVTLLTETGLDTEQRDLAGIIEESGSILLQVINDILDYSKLSSGVFQMNPTDLCIRETVQAVIRSTLTGLKQGIELRYNVDPAIPEKLNGDPLRLRQVLQNIIGNAVKFTESGTIDIDVHLLAETASTVEIMTEISDTGVGIPAAAAKTLFTPFTQLDNSATKRFKGTGLGLSICKSLVELMHGTIGFRANTPLPGSTFYFTVTMSRALQLSTPLLIKQPTFPLPLATTAKRLLLVDDNPINQKVMVKMLKMFGFTTVDIASDGRQGVDSYLDQEKGHHDLVIMDVSMPVLDGVAATQEIRYSGSSVPIIAMTANALKGDAEAFIAAGMNDYIAKPVDRTLLVGLLLKWLS
jgi:osomolarity two-component system, sensor histidine kinase TcsA